MQRFLTHRFVFLIIAGLFVTAMMLATGCATSAFDVKVDATTDGRTPKATSNSFRLVSVANSTAEKESAPEAMELASMALKGKGLRDADGASTPDLVIAVSCGLATGTSRLVTTLIPTYTTVPEPYHTETQQVGTSSNGTPIYRTVVVQEPPVDVVTGHYAQTSEVRAVKKYLRLVAFRNDPTSHPAPQYPVWAVVSVFESDDSALRKMIPVLAAAGAVFIGEETAGPVTIHIKESDPDVLALRAQRRK